MLDKPQTKSMLDTPVTERMPREIAPGVFWIGDCLAQRHKGRIYHGYNAAFLVAGETASVLVETGHPKDFPVIERHMNELFARGVAPLKYLFVTHQETPHCGGLGRILKTFPESLLVGDVSDYHLAFPQYEHRMRAMNEGDEIDLGGRTFMAVEPVIRDLRTTWWGFDTKERVLFPGDGEIDPVPRLPAYAAATFSLVPVSGISAAALRPACTFGTVAVTSVIGRPWVGPMTLTPSRAIKWSRRSQ